MPLPEGGNQPWPPPQFTEISHQMNVHATWWSGDPEQLAALYGETHWGDRPRNRPSQYRGGVIGSIARWFWGAPVPPGERRAKLHVPIASDIATASADLLFGEPPALKVDGKGAEKAQERLDELADDGMLTAVLLEAAEVQAPLGGVYLVTTWDDQVADYPWLRAVHADCVIPEFRWGRLMAATLWREVERDGQTVWRHLERHEIGSIQHGLYKGTEDNLGSKVGLKDHASTADLDDTVEGVKDRLTIDYIPNMRPSRDDRGGEYTALGRSDYTPGALSMMDGLDECWSSWMRDLDLGKGRIIVPETYLQSNGPGQGAMFDSERRVYSGLNILDRGDGSPSITASQFEIRVDEHSRTAQELVTNIVRSCGYAEQTFGIASDGSAMTATEVEARERRSYLTRTKKTRYWEAGLRSATTTLILVDEAKFSGPGIGDARIKVEFGKTIQDDLQVVAQTLQLLTAAEAASTETKVRLAHPDWDQDLIDEEVEKIRGDAAAAGGGAPPAGMDPAGFGEDPAASGPGPDGLPADPVAAAAVDPAQGDLDWGLGGGRTSG